MYRVRVDIVNDLNSDMLIEVCEPDTYVIVRHELPTGNPHYHAYFKYDNDLKENTLRQRFKRKFTYLKSTDYSIKKCDAERVNEYVQYMFNTKHGNKWELIDTRNFDIELLDSLKKNAKIITEEFEATRKQSKSKGPTIWDIAMEVEHIVHSDLTVNDLGQTIHQRHEQQYSDSKQIDVYTDVTIQILRKYRKGFDEFLIRKIITTAMSSTIRGKEILRLKMHKHFISY